MSTPSPAPLSEASDRQWAVLAHLSGIFSVVGPLIIWLVFRDRGERTVREAKEALNMQLTVLLLCAGLAACSVILDVLLLGWLARTLIGIVQLAGVVLAVIGGITCSRNGSVRYPVALRLIH